MLNQMLARLQHSGKGRVGADVFRSLRQGAEETHRLIGQVVDAAKREVRQEHAECDGQQQQGLELFDDREVHQNERDQNHDRLLPGDIGKASTLEEVY